jgi:phage-related protein
MIEAWIDGVSFSSARHWNHQERFRLGRIHGITVEIAGMDGELDFGSQYQSRIVSHECIVMADDPTTDYQAKVRALASVFDARRGVRIVTYSDLPGKQYRMRYAGTLPIQKVIFDGTFTLPMKMYDPFPESATESILETTITTASADLAIQSDGDLNASPIFVLTNTGTQTITGFTLQNEYKLE